MEEDVDLNQVLGMVIEDLELEIEEKKAKIKIDKLPTIPGHKRQLQQLFQNLITNSLKYSKPEVSPEIIIKYCSISHSELPESLQFNHGIKNFHCIEIIDNGIGFEQIDCERIFNVFTRLHGNAEYRGTGVGLSIVRKVIENHHGQILAEGAPGKGASFKLFLPVVN